MSNTTTTKPDMLKAALAYGVMGWPIIPLYHVIDGRCSCGRDCDSPGKHPQVKDWPSRATCDVGKIRRWWKRWPDANIGLACGPADLVVVDLDERPEYSGLENWQQLGIDDSGAVVSLTPSGGQHLLFKRGGRDLDNSEGDLPQGIDIRGIGGQIVLPPSNHVKGQYAWDVGAHPLDRQPGPVPLALVGRLNGGGKSSKRKGPAAPVPDVIPKGEREKHLCSLAGTMNRRNMSEGAIRAALGIENETRCDPPLAEGDLDRIAKSISSYEAGPMPKSPPLPSAWDDGLTESLAEEQKPAKTSSQEKKRERPKSAEYIATLANLGYTFRLNLCDDSLELNGEPMTDPLAAEIRARMRDLGYWRINVMQDAYLADGLKNAYHPIKQYLAGLEWDGIDHIDKLACYFQDKDGAFQFWLKRWLIGAVAKVLEGAQNTMLVLDGPQGIGKSYFVKWLCPLPSYFVEGALDPSSKDDRLRMARTWIWEVGELGASLRKADREALKFLISMRVVTERKPYGHFDVRKPAMASLIGTLNNEGGFLNDPTGSRRFLVATLTALDWAYSQEVDVHQVWAHAAALYHQGESWTLLPEEARLSQDLNAKYRVDDPIENSLRAHFELDPTRRDWWLSSHEIITTLQDHGLRGSTRGNAMALSAVLTGLGHERRKRKDANGYTGIQWKQGEGQQ